jgi:hypothetical protein
MAEFGEPGYTPEQYATVKDQVTAPPVGVGLPGGVENQVAGGGAMPTEVDVPALLARLQAQQDAMAAEIARLKSGQPAGGVHPLIGTATAARDLIAQHFDRGGVGDRAGVLALADDLVDAAGNGVQSGDTAATRQIGQRLERALAKVNPGPGDHHYFTNAWQMVTSHLLDAADTVTGPAQPSAGAVGSSQPPARVISGSVTG